MDFLFKGKILLFQQGIRKHHWYVMDYIPEETGLSTSWETTRENNIAMVLKCFEKANNF